MNWFHPQEVLQAGAVIRYERLNPGARYLVTFADGESYVCRYDTSYESENSGDLDIEMDDPRYDEFYQLAMEIIYTIQSGGRNYQDGLTLDYRDWPALIKDVDRGTVVYPGPTN